MTAISNKIFVFFFASAILLASGVYACSQEIHVFIGLLIVLAGFFLIQHPVCLFYLLMFSIPWSVEFNFTPNLGTDLPDEPLMLLASAAVVILIIDRRKKIRCAKIHPLIFILCLEIIWMMISTITSVNTILSLKFVLAKGWYLLAFLVLPVFLFKNEKVLKTSFLILFFSMLAVTIIALIKHGKWNWSFAAVNNSVAPFFRNHVNYSSLLVFMAPLQLAGWQLSQKKIRFVFTVGLFITMVALYFSYSRGAWLALMTGMLAYRLLKKRMLLIAFLIFMVLSAAAIFWISSNDRFVKFSNDYNTTIFHSDFKEHLLSTYKLKDLSNAERIYRWVAGVRMINDNWQNGVGASAFYPLYKEYTLPAFKTYVSRNAEHSTVHNYFLLTLIEQGVIGLFLFIALIATVFWYAQNIYHRTKEKFWKLTVATVASVMVMQCTINFLSDMIETDKVGSIFYLCIATIIVADYKMRKL